MILPSGSSESQLPSLFLAALVIFKNSEVSTLNFKNDQFKIRRETQAGQRGSPATQPQFQGGPEHGPSSAACCFAGAETWSQLERTNIHQGSMFSHAMGCAAVEPKSWSYK